MPEGFENKMKRRRKKETGENPDVALETELEGQGWQKVGSEYPFLTPLNPDSGRFEKRRVFTEEEIQKKYLDKYGDMFDEIRIEVSHEYKLDEWRENEMEVFVYMRKKENTNEEEK